MGGWMQLVLLRFIADRSCELLLCARCFLWQFAPIPYGQTGTLGTFDPCGFYFLGVGRALVQIPMPKVPGP